MTHHPPRRLARLARAGAAAGVAALAAAIGACDLDVATPDIVPPGRLDDTTALPTLRAGALGDFAVAYAGNDAAGDEGIILLGGLRADEFLNRDTFEERRDVDLGTIKFDNASVADAFRSLQRARRSAEFANARFARFGPNDAGYAETLALAGFTYVLLGETFCPGVPISDVDANGQFQFGQPQTLQQLMQTALARFDSALAVATRARNTEQQHVARVGRGRALLNLGRFAEAAAAVRDVPTPFVYNVEYSENTGRQNNAVFTFNNVRRRWGVANAEGRNGYDYVAAADPRVPTQTTTRNGLDGESVRIVNQLKYPARTSSIPLATGVEARLIEAEAALQGGNVGEFARLHNVVRATAALPALDAASLTRRQLEDVHFRERAFWLFATAHRLGDMRRLLRAPYGRSYGEVYPVGAYFKLARQYGTDQPSLILPSEEENNPNFARCITPN